MAGKLSWGMKVVTTSSGRFRSWARQEKPPVVAPERQGRREGMAVASAAGGARAATGPGAAGRPACRGEGARGGIGGVARPRRGRAGEEEAGEEGQRSGPPGRRTGGSRVPVHGCLPFCP